jgi:sigma-B regulation protein RsbU (phosphoserine phosphatase)
LAAVTSFHGQGSGADEGRLELALRASNEGLWDWWTGEEEIYYSRRVLDFLKCEDRVPPNVFLAPYESIHEDDRLEFAEVLRHALETTGPEFLAIDCRIRSGESGWIWLRVRGSVVRDQEGRATRIAGSMIDISRRKEAEAQIEEERHLLRMLIDHVPLQIYFKDTSSRFVLVNRQMVEWSGMREPQEMVGKHDRDLFAEAHWREALEDEREIIRTASAITGKVEHEVREDERGDTWVLTSKFPWLDRNGQVKGTFGVSSDVSDLVRAQQQAAELAAELAVRNQAYEEEVQLAREIQQALASSAFPRIRSGRHEVQFGSRYLPISGLAGDFFEVVRVGPSSVGLLICDVMGHGVRAALVVAMLRGLLEKQRHEASAPGAFLKGLNQGLCAILRRADSPVFATAFYACLNLETHTLHYACAGHPGAIVAGPDGVEQLARERSERGPGLGLMAKAEFPESQRPLQHLQRLLLFTDGILEAENDEGEGFFDKRLMEVVEQRQSEPLEEMLDGIIATVLDFAEGEHFDDDVCLLAAEIP